MRINKKTARVAGLLYLTIIIAGIFAEFFVRQSLIVPGDAATTASNIMASEGLFRLGIAADLVMIVADVALALVLYILLRPVSRALSMLAAFFRLTQAAFLGVNLLNLFFGLQFVRPADYLAVFGTGQSQAMALLFFRTHATGYALALVFFAASLLLLGYLVFKSDYFPGILGVLLIIASAGYLADSFARVLLPTYGNYEAIFTLVVFLPAFIGELVFTLWLLLKGVNLHKMQLRPGHAY